MKKLVLLLSLISLQAFAAGPVGSIGVSPQVQGGFSKNQASPAIITPLTDTIGTGTYTKITLRAGDSTSTDAAFYGFAKAGGVTGHYQVTAGKVLYCFSLSFANAGAQHYTFGYATADFTEETATPPTGIQYYSVVAATRLLGDYLGSATVAIFDTVPYYLTFPASSYPLMYLGKDAIDQWNLRLDCVEK